MSLPSSDRILSVHLALAQYPILATRIRELMRAELYNLGIISSQALLAEATQWAIRSQEREGLHNPLSEEAADTWEYRKSLMLSSLTDSYFAQNLPYDALAAIIERALTERGVMNPETIVEFNPETAPMEVLFNQGMSIEKLPLADQTPYAARLHEIKVVLIRKMISDQLRYINIAKDWFTISDLAEIRRHKLGQGRIGGKAAGMLLAARILKEKASPALRSALQIPTSFYVGSDLVYTFMSVNNLLHWNDQKYKSDAQMRSDYPLIVAEFEQGDFPPGVMQYMETILSMAGGRPLIVRSSSLLEDNFGTAFAGKYDSIFLPNQGEPEVNLHALKIAMARIYASTLNPAAIQYRESRGLLDYDERMALLIQVVEGQAHGRYYFPQLAGVAFSHNAYRWSPQIKASMGFLRLVWGMGTRAVDRVGNDYPRLVALSHPTLNPSASTKTIRRYSQQYIDLIDLEADKFITLPVSEVLRGDTPGLRYLAQLDSDGYIHSMRIGLLQESPRDLILTFEELMRQTEFPNLMVEMLQTLQREYGAAVDEEFTARIVERGNKPEIELTLIQCRPLSTIKEGTNTVPTDTDAADKVFTGSSLVAGGTLKGITHVLYVPAEAYFAIKDPQKRFALERAIGKVNAALKNDNYICVGPGRWGTSNPDLGVHVDYADIFNTKALVEIAGGKTVATEPSLGTHFFQDLMEGQIYPLAIDAGRDYILHKFFDGTPNRLNEWIDVDDALQNLLKIIHVADFRDNHHLDVVMDDTTGKSLAFLVSD